MFFLIHLWIRLSMVPYKTVQTFEEEDISRNTKQNEDDEDEDECEMFRCVFLTKPTKARVTSLSVSLVD